MTVLVIRAKSRSRGTIEFISTGSLTPLHFAEDDERLDARHFLTISTFSIMAMPPRSASLPFTVMFLPQYSAS
jgi:hypothetical protein